MRLIVSDIVSCENQIHQFFQNQKIGSLLMMPKKGMGFIFLETRASGILAGAMKSSTVSLSMVFGP